MAEDVDVVADDLGGDGAVVSLLAVLVQGLLVEGLARDVDLKVEETNEVD